MPTISELDEQYASGLLPEDWIAVVSRGALPDTTCKVQLQSLLIFFLPPGTLLPLAFSTPPEGWLLCDGSAVSRATYANLFSAIGTTWGAGDGSSTFNLPDLRGRAVIGRGQGSGLTNRALGATGGAETHTLTTAQIPAHTHGSNMSAFYGSGGYSWTTGPYAVGQLASGSAGGGGSHPIMQPWAAITWAIKT